MVKIHKNQVFQQLKRTQKDSLKVSLKEQDDTPPSLVPHATEFLQKVLLKDTFQFVTS